MEHFQAIGVRTFSLSQSTCSVFSPRFFNWSAEFCETQVYFDEAIVEGANLPFHSRKYGWLAESIAHRPDIYEYLLNNYERVLEQYVAIFTSSRQLLELDPRFVFCYSGSNIPWIKPEERRIYPKSKTCSMIASPIVVTHGHRLRQEAAMRFRPHLDLFGGALGSPEVRDADNRYHSNKLPMLKDYMFSIVMENARYSTYFTEKIMDCFVSGTVPVYWGSPDIGRYFNSDGIIELDKSFDPTDLTPELYNSKLSAIRENFERACAMMMADDYLYQLIYADGLRRSGSDTPPPEKLFGDIEPVKGECLLPVHVDLRKESDSGTIIRGFHECEDWGRWTSLPVASIQFPFNLPKKFRLVLLIKGFGPNQCSEARVLVGDYQKRVSLDKDIQNVVLDVEIANDARSVTLEIPKSYNALDTVGVADDRFLGVGLERISIEPAANAIGR